MEKFNEVFVSNEPLSKTLKAQDVSSFAQACDYIRNLPYGRNSDRSDFNLILREEKGTCSTKHAFLKQLAIENNIPVELCIGVYKMNAENTKGIGSVLDANQLDYIPEAHCYLKFEGKRYDFTKQNSNANMFESVLLFEASIQPEQIGDYKVALHQDYIKSWIASEGIPYAFEDVWTIREACIANLSA
ncbi:hypothetical protein [Winogradskyella sp. 3972H.M.0a.05]|uniref:hypothetical protein n=1 Tax=Winogradskyella sp. 3972H.M.0a.05 TaxID=2950277 RepID=UPI003392E3AA